MVLLVFSAISLLSPTLIIKNQICSDCSVAKEIVGTQEETNELVTSAPPPSLTDLAQNISNVDQYCLEVSRALDPNTIQMLSEAIRTSLPATAGMIIEKDELLLTNC